MDTQTSASEKDGGATSGETSAEKMEVDDSPASSPTADGVEAAKDATASKTGEQPTKSTKDSTEKSDAAGAATPADSTKDAATAEKKREPEPAFELLDNPARVMPQQRKVVSLPEGCGYTSVKPVSLGGIVIVSRVDKESEEELVPPVPLGGTKKSEDDEPEPEPPEDFEWTED